MYILGLGGSVHDYSACLLDDSKILTFIEEERITRSKNGINLGVKLANGYSRKYCCKENNIEISDIPLVVANDIINPCMLFRLNNVIKINHHLSHAASSFFCSPYNEAAILVIDSVGSKLSDNTYETISYYYGKGNKIELIERKTGTNLQDTDYISNSIGMFYSLVTEYIGFSELQEGKTMGLAPYGTNKKVNELLSNVDINNGEFKFDLSRISYFQNMIHTRKKSDMDFQTMSDYAYAAQKILEVALINCCKHIKQLTACNNLCLAGGTFLNSVANYKIYKQNIFKNIFIQPATGDNGTSIGAALYGYYNILNNKRISH